MTTLGRSPPRSKKGSSAASSVLTAGSIVAELELDDCRADPDGSRDDEPTYERGVVRATPVAPEPDVPSRQEARAQARATRRQQQTDAKRARREAEQQEQRRGERDEEQEQQQAAEATAGAELAAAGETQDGVAPDADDLGPEPADEPEPETTEPETTETGAQPEKPSAHAVEDAADLSRLMARAESERLEAEQQESVAREQAEADASAAKAALRRERQEAKEAARREREQTKELARHERREAKDRRSGAEDDGIVEPPRAPRTSFLQRRRGSSPAVPGTSGGPRPGTSVLAVAAGIVGAIGLICSVVLALGALLAALGTEDGTVYDVVSSTCDVLAGPLRDLFTFSGANADMWHALVAWGLGSMVYLVVGLVAQSVVRSRIED